LYYKENFIGKNFMYMHVKFSGRRRIANKHLEKIIEAVHEKNSAGIEEFLNSDGEQFFGTTICRIFPEYRVKAQNTILEALNLIDIGKINFQMRLYAALYSNKSDLFGELFDEIKDPQLALEGLSMYQGNELDVFKKLLEKSGDLADKELPSLFHEACYRGNFEIARYLFESGGEEVKKKVAEVFDDACKSGNFELVRYLFEEGGKAVQAKAVILFEEACYDGNLELVKYLYSLDEAMFKAEAPEVFFQACKNNKLDLELAKYLYSLDEEEIKLDAVEEFSYACQNGNLELANYLYSLDEAGGKAQAAKVFPIVCRKGKFEIASYLYSLDEAGVKAQVAKTLMDACRADNFELVNYLYRLDEAGVKAQAATALIYACRADNFELRNYLYRLDEARAKAEVAKAFLIAYRNGDLKLAKYLSSLDEAGVKAQVAEALIFACQNNKLEVVQFLFMLNEAECQANALEPFLSACRTNKFELIEYLIQHGGEAIKAHANQALLIACQRDKLEFVKHLYSLDAAGVKAKAAEGFLIACQRGNLELASYLYSLDEAGVKAQAARALIFACQKGKLELAKYLYSLDEAGVKAKAAEMLSYLCQTTGNLKIAKFLYSLDEAGVKAQAARALIFACQSNDLEMVQFLFMLNEAECQANALQPFLRACQYKEFELIECLIQHGGEAIKAHANQALLIACERDKLEFVKHLYSLDAAGVKAKAAEGFLIACEKGNLEVVKYLYSLDELRVKVRLEEVVSIACRFRQGEILDWLVQNVDFKGVERQVFLILCRFKQYNEAQKLISKLTIFDLPLSKFISVDLNQPGIVNEIQSFYDNPVSFLESKKAPSLQIEIARLLQLQYEASNALHKKYEDPESAMNKQMLEKADKHFDEVVWPHFEKVFDATPGETEKEKIQYIESQMRSAILARALQDESITPEIKAFIVQHREGLEKGSDNHAMKVLREQYFNSISNVNHIAWRCLDREAPRVVWTNMMTSSLDEENGLKVRKRAAVYFLAVMDKTAPDDKEMRISNFIGHLADIRRAHNKDEGPEGDNPSCLPGTLGRIADMGNYHPIAALPTDDITLFLKTYDTYVLENFKIELDKILSFNDHDMDMAESSLEMLFYSLTGLSSQFAKEIIMGSREYEDYHLSERLRFFDVLAKGKYQSEGLDAIERETKVLFEQQYPGRVISEEDRAQFMAALIDVGSEERAIKLGNIYSKYVDKEGLSEQEKEEILSKPGFNPYEEGNDESVLFNLFAKSLFEFSKEPDIAKKWIENMLSKEKDLKNVTKEQWVERLKETGAKLEVNAKLIDKVCGHIGIFWSKNPLENARRFILLDSIEKISLSYIPEIYTTEKDAEAGLAASRSLCNMLSSEPNLIQLDKNGLIELLNYRKSKLNKEDEGDEKEFRLINKLIEHINQQWSAKGSEKRVAMLSSFKAFSDDKGKEEEKEQEALSPPRQKKPKRD
jgi:ankyrin repeat protein